MISKASGQAEAGGQGPSDASNRQENQLRPDRACRKGASG